MTIKGSASTSGTVSLAAGETTQLTLETQYADEVTILIDNGSGSAPSSYNLSVEVYSNAHGAWFELSSATESGSTAVSHEFTAPPPEIRVTVERPSGASSSASYRAQVVAYEG